MGDGQGAAPVREHITVEVKDGQTRVVVTGAEGGYARSFAGLVAAINTRPRDIFALHDFAGPGDIPATVKLYQHLAIFLLRVAGEFIQDEEEG